jgi:tRNA pseudouridine38-40 synthase
MNEDEATTKHRYAFAIEYDGTPFSGWQYQHKALTIQQTIQEALAKLLSENVLIYAAGRTDRGVHALGQVFHADFDNAYSVDRLRRGLNAHLAPWPLSIWQVAPVPLSFHARFSARQRTYIYDICNRSSPSPLWDHRAWWVPQSLNHDLLQRTALMLVGHHDFSAFRHRDCQSSSPWKNVDSIDIENSGHWIRIRVSARSFLHRQVRMMVGAMISVSLGRTLLQEFQGWIEAPHEHTRKAPSAPAHGLYFAHVDFDSPHPFASVPSVNTHCIPPNL